MPREKLEKRWKKHGIDPPDKEGNKESLVAMSVVLFSKMAFLCNIIRTRTNWTLLCGIGLVNVFNKLIPGNDYFSSVKEENLLSFLLKCFRSLG